MGMTINMYAQYKDKDGNWHRIKSPHNVPSGTTMCVHCDCDPDLYCSRYKNSIFFLKVLMNKEMKRTYWQDMKNFNPGYNSEPREFNAITLTDLKNFNWDGETYIKKNALGFKEGTRKYSEISKDFIDFTMPNLEKLSDIYGGPDNVRIIFDFDC